MSKENQIIRELLIFLDMHVPKSFTGKVIEVDEGKGTALVQHGELRRLVKMKSVIDGSSFGLYVIPKIGAIVFCVPEGMDSPVYYLAGCNEVDKVKLKMENFEVVVDNASGEMVLNTGQNEGIPIVGALLQKLNALESSVNELKQIIASWVPIAQDGGAALKTALTSWYGSMLAVTQMDEIENEKIKH